MFLLIKFTLLYAVVLMLVAMGGMFSERSGVINIALEGIMAIGGLAGVFVLVLFPDLPAPALVALSILASAVSGMIYSLLLGFSAITLKADQTIGGTALNMLATAIAIVLVKAFNNGSDAALDASMLSGDYAAKLGAEGPQVLIIHTHGSESYTMPPGQEYDVSDTFRTLDTNCNMIRIGDEMAQVLTDAGISVVHDLILHPNRHGIIKKPLDEPYYRDIAIATSAAAQPSTITRMFCEHALEWARDTSPAIAPATAEAPEYAELAK